MMKIRFASVFTLVLLMMSLSTLNAQPGDPGDPTPVPIPDSGTVLCNEASNPTSKIKSWVSRAGDKASALSVFAVGTIPKAVLRRYEINGDGDGYQSVDTVLTLPDGSPAISLKCVPLDLAEVPNRLGTYSLSYNHNGQSLAVGYVRFVRGRDGRRSSDVVLRLEHNAVAGVGNPCDGPPIDDMGEEEEIGRGVVSPSIPANSPASTLLLIP